MNTTRFEELKQTLLALPSPCPLDQARRVVSELGTEMAQIPRVCTTEEMFQLMDLCPPTMGSAAIPRDQWIDPNKTYKTTSGKKVTIISVELINEKGQENMAPVRAIIVDQLKPLKERFAIFTLEGKRLILGNHPDDLRLA